MDIICAQCGEPWESWGINNGEMSKNEAKFFLHGRGCPECGEDKPQSEGKFFMDYANSLMDGSDQDPLEFLTTI